ncbi:MAG: hypothetical protein LBT58_03975 [Endomicrobium sp.]|nr:hypothetical protein [Endomicrobium sp.]
MKIIKDSAGRLKYFINNVLSLSEIRAGKVKAKGILAYADEVVKRSAILDLLRTWKRRKL